MKPVILATRHLPAATEATLRGLYRFWRPEEDVAPEPTALGALCDAGMDGSPTAGLIVTPTDRIDAACIATLPDSVRIIATFSVGFEHIDLAAAARRGITVTNTPGVLTDATADLALLLILAAARRAGEGERELRSGRWTGWRPTHMMGTHLGDKRLGIVGMGRIGQAVAARARAFGMLIHYHNRTPLPAGQDLGATYHATPESLLAVSDILSLHCPATPETRHFLNAERLAHLPQGAIVVNTARGAVVDDDALIAALRSGQVRAAGLDVYTGEPALHPAYPTLDNTVLLPHLGSATVETRTAMGDSVIASLGQFFSGLIPENAIRHKTL